MSEDIQADLPAGASEEQPVEAPAEQQENPDHEKAITNLADEAIHATETNAQLSQEPVDPQATHQTEQPQVHVDDGVRAETPAPVSKQEEQVLDLDEHSSTSPSEQNPENNDVTVEPRGEQSGPLQIVSDSEWNKPKDLSPDEKDPGQEISDDSVEEGTTDNSEWFSEEPSEHSTPVHEYFNLNPDRFGAMPTAEFIKHANEYIQINIDLEQAKRTVEELEKRKKQLREEALNYGEHAGGPADQPDVKVERSDVDPPDISPAEQIGEAVPSL